MIQTNNSLKTILSVLVAGCFILILINVGTYLYLKKKSHGVFSEKEFLITEVTSSSKELSQLKVKTENLLKENKKLLSENETFSKENSSTSNELTDLKNKNASLLSDYNIILREKSDLESTIENIKTEKNALIEQIKTIESQSFVADTLKQKTMLEIEIKKLREQIKEKEVSTSIENSSLKEKHQNEIGKLKSMIRKLKAEAENKSGYETQLENLKKEITALNSLNAQLKQQIFDVNKEKEQIANSFAQQLATEKHLKNLSDMKVEEQMNTYTALKEKNDTLLQKQSHWDATKQDLLSEIKKRDDEVTDLKAQLNQVNESLKLRMQELARSKGTIENIISKTRSSISTMDDRQIMAAKARVPQVIDTYTQPAKTNAPEKAVSYFELKKNPALAKKTSEIKSKIIDVDYKYSFIVINVGQNQGINKNMKVKILQNNEVVAEGQIMEVRKAITAINFKLLHNATIQKGDTVICY